MQDQIKFILLLYTESFFFTCLKNSPKRILIINSWNSENILSFIFSKSSGKRENGL